MTCICKECICEPALVNLLQEKFSDKDYCDYCAEGVPTIEIELVAQQCDAAISIFYELTSNKMAVVHFQREPEGSDVRTILEELIPASEVVVDDILEALEDLWFDRTSEEREYGEDPWFILKSRMASPLNREWEEMEASLRLEARHLNPKVYAFLESVFGAIDSEKTVIGSSVLINGGPGATIDALYRARVFQSEKKLSEALEAPERELSAPPAAFAKSGRMNASGQPAFYGANDESIALAEVRPPVGSWVVVAKFKIIRPLRLLDLRLLSQVHLVESDSLFDPATTIAAHRRAFLQELADKMVAPVMPESQDHDYLLTQVVADYLAMHPRTPIDGMIYKSGQCNNNPQISDHANVVLFNKAVGTIRADFSGPTAKVDFWDCDHTKNGDEWSFYPQIRFIGENSEETKRLNDHKAAALELVQDSIRIHKVKSVAIQTDSNSVRIVNTSLKRENR